MKMQDGPAFVPQNGQLHHTLGKNYYLQQIDLLQLRENELMARIHCEAQVLAELEKPMHPSCHISSSTNANNAYNILL